MATRYLSPTGLDTNDGTITSPWFTLTKAWTVISAGDIVYLRGGTYEYEESQELTGKNGTSGSLIKIWAYPGEVPVITKAGIFTPTHRVGIYFTGDYFHWKGLTITGFTQIDANFWGGMRADGASYNTFETLNIYDNGHGFACVGDAGPCDGNLFLNCDFHHNYDPLTAQAYDNADGLEIGNIVSTAYSNTVRGCRSWSNSDDGFDLWANNSFVLFDNCWAWNNGWREDGVTSGGNGEGFKFGDTDDHHTLHLRTVQNCLSFWNKEGGFSADGVYAIIWAFNNTAFHNSLVNGEYNLGFEFASDAAHGSHVLRNNASFDTQYYGPTHPAQYEATYTYCTEDHNTWDGAVTITSADFISTSITGVDGARQSDGSLPILDFLKLTAGSDLIGAGVTTSNTTDALGNPWNSSPSMGAYEYGSSGVILVADITITAAGGATTISTYHGTLQFAVTEIIPSDATDQTVVWSVVTITGSATITQTGLVTAVSDGTIYVYAYANDGGGAYGRRTITISNQSVAGTPTINTSVISQVTNTSAVSGGNVTDDGGAAVSARGICYSTSPNPTTADTTVAGGSGLGLFASSLTGLTKNVTYHVRAYATNANGTSYGTDLSFTTRAFMIVVYPG